jgi:hypothetical protein
VAPGNSNASSPTWGTPEGSPNSPLAGWTQPYPNNAFPGMLACQVIPFAGGVPNIKWTPSSSHADDCAHNYHA